MSNQQTQDTRDMKDDVSELPVPSQFDEVEEQAKEFVRSHFGNPESGEVYGVGNDYESEEDQVRHEKASAGQAVWIIGSLLLLTAIGYWVIR